LAVGKKELRLRPRMLVERHAAVMADRVAGDLLRRRQLGDARLLSAGAQKKEPDEGELGDEGGTCQSCLFPKSATAAPSGRSAQAASAARRTERSSPACSAIPPIPGSRPTSANAMRCARSSAPARP